jgi:hypothetical protein
MIARLIFAAWISFQPTALLAQTAPAKPAAPAKPNAVMAAEAGPNDRARQWLTLVDDGNYAQSWKDSGTAFRKRPADAWAKFALEMRDPLGAVASRSLKSVDVSKPRVAVVSYDTAFARRTGVVETVTLSFENGGWAVTDYMVR